MLGIVILSILVVIPLIVLFFIRGRDSQGPRKPAKQTMLYAPGSTDIAAEAYHSPRKDSTMPFPLGKKEEREKTETFRRHSED
ncbi:MAG: hypothetical protein ACXACG_09760 [Candidatus Thorarchaeota archaeon]|jgi:hypothetical protein